MLGLNPSKSNRFQIGQAKYPRPKGRASLQSDMEVWIHAFTRIGMVTASRMLVWKNHPNNSVQYQRWQRCQEMSTREFRAYRGISRPRVNQKSGPSQGPRGKWKDTIIVSAWPKLQAIAKKGMECDCRKGSLIILSGTVHTGVEVRRIDSEMSGFVEQSWLQLICCTVCLPRGRNFRWRRGSPSGSECWMVCRCWTLEIEFNKRLSSSIIRLANYSVTTSLIYKWKV